jgi:CheY-like chemotaxis protein
MSPGSNMSTATGAFVPRVLVVEDHAINRKFMGVLLDRLDCQTSYCEDGQQALDKVQAEVFDLILMDVNMPVMDGLTATRAIRALASDTAQVPIVVITADVSVETHDEAMASGATDFLTKPVQIAKFREVVNKYLASAKSAKTTH